MGSLFQFYFYKLAKTTAYSIKITLKMYLILCFTIKNMNFVI